MPLTPADVHNVAFSKPPIGKRGYNEDEVDAFLDLVENELTRLIEENSDLRQRIEELDHELASGGGASAPAASVQPTQAIPVYEPEPEPVKPAPVAPIAATVAAPVSSTMNEEQAIKAAHAQRHHDKVEIAALHPHQRFLERVGREDFVLGRQSAGKPGDGFDAILDHQNAARLVVFGQGLGRIDQAGRRSTDW